ncbi:MAG: heparinase [Flavobacteriaceae bacterium]|nr:heparinase [Flavobacteriaceae bacterium]
MKILLYLNTLKFLKFEQFFFRFFNPIWRKVYLYKKKRSFQIRINNSDNWIKSLIYSPKLDFKDGSISGDFLNHKTYLSFPDDWNSLNLSKLWLYNLHYFNDLVSLNVFSNEKSYLLLINRWIDENPIGHGNGWEPYTLSLRIVNIHKSWLNGLQIDKKIFFSLYQQTDFLRNNLERHLLGNHYFSNLKALLFSGIILNNKSWLNFSEKGLIEQIPEQILPDGSSYELSPMYHNILLIDMLDIYNLSLAYPSKISDELKSLLAKYLPLMILFMKAMSHGDKGVSFFNDSVDGIAPDFNSIINYSKSLGLETPNILDHKKRLIDFSDSGYFVANYEQIKIIFDTSEVGPSYIPGHAHADSLSFEMSIGAERVFVNKGISHYDQNEERLMQRKTISHNTVEIDGKDSSQVWGSHRVAKRAEIIERDSYECTNYIKLKGTHNGYKNLFFSFNTSRTIKLNKDSIKIKEVIEGNFKTAIVRFYIHPNLKVTLSGNKIIIVGNKFKLCSGMISGKPILLNSFWHPQFGVSIPNKCLEIHFSEKELLTEFTWKLI